MDIGSLIESLNLGHNSNYYRKHTIHFYSNLLFNLNNFYTKEEFERDNQKYLGLRNYEKLEYKFNRQ